MVKFHGKQKENVRIYFFQLKVYHVIKKACRTKLHKRKDDFHGRNDKNSGF